MKAARLHEYGARLALDEVPEPLVENPQDVLVRIGGAGVCRTDLHILNGQLAGAVEVELPYTLGHENAGWVAEVGSAVTDVAVGDPVLVHPLVTCGLCRACRAGEDVHCEHNGFPGLTQDGGFAELLKTSVRSLVKLPAGLEPVAVAALADAGLAAYHAVKKAVTTLHPGTTAAVIGAGGLGHLAIQCLRALTAARVVALDVSEQALALARDLGAHHVLAVDGSHVGAVHELTNGLGVEAVFDFVGEGDTVVDSVEMLRRAGTYYAVGYGGTLNLETVDIVARELSLVGNLVGSYNELQELTALAAQGRVRLETVTYPLEAVNDALEDLRAGRLRGRGVLLP